MNRNSEIHNWFVTCMGCKTPTRKPSISMLCRACQMELASRCVVFDRAKKVGEIPANLRKYL